MGSSSCYIKYKQFPVPTPWFRQIVDHVKRFLVIAVNPMGWKLTDLRVDELILAVKIVNPFSGYNCECQARGWRCHETYNLATTSIALLGINYASANLWTAPTERGAFIEINNPKWYFITSLLPSTGMRSKRNDGNPQPLPLLRRKSITLFFMCH